MMVAASTRERVTERPPTSVIGVDPKDLDLTARAFFTAMPLDEEDVDVSLPAAVFLAQLA